MKKAIYICDDMRPYIQNTVETFNRNFFFLITEEQVLYSFRFNHSLHIQVNLLKNFVVAQVVFTNWNSSSRITKFSFVPIKRRITSKVKLIYQKRQNFISEDMKITSEIWLKLLERTPFFINEVKELLLVTYLTIETLYFQ